MLTLVAVLSSAVLLASVGMAIDYYILRWAGDERPLEHSIALGLFVLVGSFLAAFLLSTAAPTYNYFVPMPHVYVYFWRSPIGLTIVMGVSVFCATIFKLVFVRFGLQLELSRAMVSGLISSALLQNVFMTMMLPGAILQYREFHTMF